MGCKTPWKFMTFMTRHLHCGETRVTIQHHQMSHFIIKYYTCHENDTPKYETHFLKTAETLFTVRGRSDHDPTTIRAWTRSPQPLQQLSSFFALTILRWKMVHFALRLSFQIPRRKVTVELKPNTAPAKKKYCATWMQLHEILRLPRKVTVGPHQIPHLKRNLNVQLECNFTQYCACHEKYTVLLLYYSLTLRRRSYIRSFSTKLPLIMAYIIIPTCHLGSNDFILIYANVTRGLSNFVETYPKEHAKKNLPWLPWFESLRKVTHLQNGRFFHSESFSRMLGL